MKIGFIGLGKLGLPVALAVESKGHEVIGYDISAQVKNIIDTKKIPYKEKDYWHDNPPELKANEERTELEFAEFVMAAGDGNIGAKHIRNLVDLKSPKELIWKSSLVLDEYGEYRSLQTIPEHHYLLKGELKRFLFDPPYDERLTSFLYSVTEIPSLLLISTNLSLIFLNSVLFF